MAKILIVEDDTIMLKIYHKKLQLEGFEVDTALDGVTGLTKIRTFKPDLVLMDVMLPKLNGIEAMEKAKADPAISKTHFLVLSNLSTTADSETAINKGADGFMIKSDVTPAQVVAKVKQILKI